MPLAVLFAFWLWFAFSSGGAIADQWLLPGMLFGVFGIVVALLLVYPHRPRGLSLSVLAMFCCYSLVVALSVLWADSVTRVWLEGGRTFSYLLVFALALIFLREDCTRRYFRYLLMVAAFVLLTVSLARLGSVDADHVAGLMVHRRLSYPVGYPNNAAALFLVTFWPLLWLAAGPEERAPVRGIALGLATGLLALAVLTQSHGAAYGLALSLLFTFLISPARLRTLFYLLVPALLMVYAFPHLNRYWLEGPDIIGGGIAVRTVALAAAIAALVGFILAMLERWIKVC
jgi:hypothetical protein